MSSLLELGPIPWVSREVVWKDGPYTLESVERPFDYGMEGFLLGHCLGTKQVHQFRWNHVVLSLRDRIGVPHCTVLLARKREHSPYGRCDDLINSTPAFYKGESMHLLQIRGREDRLARPEYHRLIRKWWKESQGTVHRPDWMLDAVCFMHGDKDKDYHYGYMLDRSKNLFNPNFYKEVEQWRSLLK